MSQDQKITCEVCKKEIPRSVAISMEGSDYIHHFCSESCHDHYFRKHPAKKKSEK